MKTDRLFALIFGFIAILVNGFGGSFHTAIVCALMGIVYAVLAITES